VYEPRETLAERNDVRDEQRPRRGKEADEKESDTDIDTDTDRDTDTEMEIEGSMSTRQY
jgi:hypothetical protein